MAIIFLGLGFIAFGIFLKHELKNKNSPWVWTHSRAMDRRLERGDEYWESSCRIQISILIVTGIFFILDKALGLDFLSNDWWVGKG